MTRVLAVAWAVSDHKGGGEPIGTYELVRHLALEGVKVDLVTPAAALLHALPDGATLHLEPGEKTWGNTGPNKLAMIRGAHKLLRQHEYDALHVMSQFTSFPILKRPFVMSGCYTFPVPPSLAPPAGSPLLAAWKRRGPRLTQDLAYALLWERARGWNLDRTLREADCIIVRQSKGLKAYPQARRVEHIPFGTDPNLFHTDKKDGSILLAAILGRNKAPDVLLHAYAQIAHEFPESRLKLAGAGPEEKTLRALAHTLRITHRVDFLGHVPRPQLAPLFARATAYVLPSRWESFGQSALEALASGTPVLVSEAISGAYDYVEEGVNGHLIPPDDPETLANRLRTLLANPELAHRMGEAGRRTVQRFTWREAARRHAEVYASLT